MRIPSNPTLENSVFRPIPVCDASALWPPRGLNSKGLKSTDGEGPLSVGYPTLARIAISIQRHPRTVE